MFEAITAEDFRTMNDIVEDPLPSPTPSPGFSKNGAISNAKLLVVITGVSFCFVIIVIAATIISQLDEKPQRFGPSADNTANFFPPTHHKTTVVTTLRPLRDKFLG
ncbi:hypothetical protein L3Y34_014033 [Caenorhabditis briggsae]|uniref:Uncharacterized protein n=1 Tax=Caenorhabditis briggsae TaxID=6238 RepID=A0AAE9IXI3_CAEBR|nr:hypothetical protein L3Y34_014033 [Caenorhabditis briggsae]